ncbi:transcriptional regulator [Mycobacterium antarcticum]|uniref:helix-turn-helix transcriptional regulator n=1 Tax=Mycolicibacterium sp. TUM20983 TaxID=3023369 RepID=UPI0023882415|nr:LuxR family transcriptional regulator [Mycolicibacterium sp. TUM20983]GLP77743.1 transcriptional regulator [Mycolicibacterium sp. TUM20983]
MARQWQMLDRPAEFDAISQALTDPGSGGVVLVGPAGVGKTTLARGVVAALPSEVHWIACTESARSIPLGVFAHQVPPSGSRDPLALIASARKSLLAQANPTIGVDDAYLLDELSATLVHQLAVEGAAKFVATVRSGEPVPDAVTSLWKDGYLKRFELAPLSKQQSIALVEIVLGGRLEGLSADVMWESSGGNPLFLRHLVEGAVDAGTLTEVSGVWQLRGGAVISSGLASLLSHRLDRASDAVMRTLKLLALCEPCDIDVLCSLAGEDAVDDAEVQGLIRVARDGVQLNARFSHPLYGDVVRQRTGTASARRLRGNIVTALRERSTDTTAARIRLAQLYVGSDQPPDVNLLITAAKDAISLSNVPLGELLARAALDHGGGLRAAEVLSRALLWQGRPAEADGILAQFDPNDLDELQLVQWGIPRASILFWSMGAVDQAHSVMQILAERVRHHALKLVVQATSAALAVHENKIEEGLAAAEAVLSDPEAPKQAFEFAAFSAGLAMPVAGRGGDFEPIAAMSRAQQKPTDGMIKVMVRYGDVLALTTVGQLDLADERAAAYATFSSSGQRLGWAIAKITAGVVATYRGRFPDAIAAIEQALAALAAEASLPWRLPARLLLVRSYSALGDVDQAERVLTEAAEHTGPSVAIHEPQVLIAKSWLAAAKSSERSALEFGRAAADLAHKSGQYAVEGEALHHLARLGDRTVAGRLRALEPRITGPLADLYARHAAAVSTADGAALDAVSVAFERAGFLLSAADSAAQAASVHDRAGNRRRNSESAARALRLAALCGGVLTPAVRRAAAPLPVTSREREIAAMVAAGLTNREIADSLVVSVRTVEGHIYRACIKLDVTDREELGRIVRPDA